VLLLLSQLQVDACAALLYLTVPLLASSLLSVSYFVHMYCCTVCYQQVDAYSALPYFLNPLLAACQLAVSLSLSLFTCVAALSATNRWMPMQRCRTF
jgi:hypothetical protein